MPVTEGLYWEEHGSGKPLILSSGLGGSAGYWEPNIAALAARYRVIAYDHRGTGRSEREIAGRLTVDAMADDIATVLDAAGAERATVVGHAAGGLAGLALALRAPQRISRLVVINGWAKLDPHTARCFDTRLALLRDSGPRAYIHAQPLFLYPPEWISENHRRLIEEEEAQLAHFPAIEMVQRRIAAVRLFNISKRLGDIRVPLLGIVSEDDMLVPPHCTAELVREVDGAEMVRARVGGHACNVTRAKIFNDWLLAWPDRD